MTTLTVGTIYCGDTDSVVFTVTPASVLVGATARAALWVGPITDPDFAVAIAPEALTIDTAAGTVEVPITEADWTGFPAGLAPTIMMIEVELRREGAVKTLPHQAVKVKPQRQGGAS